MNRHIIPCVAAVLLLLTLSASAFTFKEEEFYVEIPESSNTYYYTPRGSNMTGTMLENAQKQDVLCLIGTYRDNTLLYTIKAERRQGPQPELIEALGAELTAYTLEDAVPATLAGVDGFSFSGMSVQDPNFGVLLYVVKSDPCLMFTVLYSLETDAQQQAQGVLSTLHWVDAADALPGVVDGVPTPLPSPVPQSPPTFEPPPVPPDQTPQSEPLSPLPEPERLPPAWLADLPFWAPWAAGGALIFALGLTLYYQKKRYHPRYARGHKRR